MKADRLALVLLTIIIVAPVAATSYKFMNGSLDYNGWKSIDPWGGEFYDTYPYQFDLSVPESWGIMSPATHYRTPPLYQPINYVAYTIHNNADTKFWDVNGNGIIHDGLLGWDTRREEGYWNGTYWHWYAAGNLQQLTYTTTQAYSVGFYSGVIDHVVVGGVAPYNIIDTIGYDWYVKKDLLDPTQVGLYSDTDTLVNPNTMQSYWSISPYLTTGWKSGTWTVRTKHLSSGLNINTTTILQNDLNFATGNISYNLTSMLFNSGAPYGLYSQELYFGSSLEDFTTFMYTSAGATILWDKSQYGIGDVATIASSVSSGYWDPSTYTYTGKIIDLYGVTHASWPITSQTQSHDVDLTGYDVGDYYAVIVASSGGTDHYMGFDIASINDAVNIYGYTVNAYTGGVVPLTHVSFLKDGTFHNSVGGSDGTFNETGLTFGSEIGVNATKTGFNHTTWGFTPPAAGTYTLNLSMLPDYIENHTAIAGIVYEDWSHNAIPGATVWVSNATWTGTSTTATGMGFYMFDGQSLVCPGESYRLNATATGYGQSIDYSRSPIAGLALLQNIEMTPQYILTVNIVDATSGAPIVDSVYVTATGGYSATTTTGTTTLTLPFGAYTVAASASGYVGDSEAIVMTGPRTVTLHLSKSAAGSSMVGVYYPHHVQFHVVDVYGKPIEGALITAQGVSTTAGSWDWLLSILGVNWQETPIHNSSMSGSTDPDGNIVFMMVPEIYYNISVLKTGAISKMFHLYPKEEDYLIQATGGGVGYTGGYNQADLLNWTLTKDDTAGTIRIEYTDWLNETTAMRFNVTAMNTSTLNETHVQGWIWPGGTDGHSIIQTFTLVSPAGKSYYIHANGTHTEFGFVYHDWGVTFPAAPPLAPLTTFGIPDELWMFGAVGFMFLTGMIFGATSAPFGAFIICIEAWVFTALQFMNYIIRTNPTGYYAGLSVATVVSFLALLRLQQRQEGYP